MTPPNIPNGTARPAGQRPTISAPGLREVKPNKDNNVLKAVAIGTGAMAAVGLGVVGTAAAMNAGETSDSQNNLFSKMAEEAAKATAETADNHQPEPVQEVHHVEHVDHHVHLHHHHDTLMPGEPKIDVVEVGSCKIGGNTVDVAIVKVNGTNGAFIDIDRNNTADLLWLDTNDNGQMEDNEVFPLEGRNVNMDVLALHQGTYIGSVEAGLFTPTEVNMMANDMAMHSAEDASFGPDYTNDADLAARGDEQEIDTPQDTHENAQEVAPEVAQEVPVEAVEPGDGEVEVLAVENAGNYNAPESAMVDPLEEVAVISVDEPAYAETDVEVAAKGDVEYVDTETSATVADGGDINYIETSDNSANMTYEPVDTNPEPAADPTPEPTPDYNSMDMADTNDYSQDYSAGDGMDMVL